MLENKVKRALQRGEVVIGTMIQESRSPAIAQILANIGFDFMFIDMEHGAYDLETVADIIRVARLAGICPLVRVPDPEYHLMARPLDAGAQGVMIPRVEAREQVERIVERVRYPPVGVRGVAASRGHTDYRRQKLRSLADWLNQETLIVIQIERRRALERVEELVSVPGVDVALVGTNDLALSLGVPEPTDQAIIAGVERVITACREAGVAPGIHLRDVEALGRWMRRGVRMIACSTDVDLLQEAASRALEHLRAVAAEVV